MGWIVVCHLHLCILCINSSEQNSGVGFYLKDTLRAIRGRILKDLETGCNSLFVLGVASL